MNNAPAAQHSMHPIPGNGRRGLNGESLHVFGSLRDLKLVPAKQCRLVPPLAANATPLARYMEESLVKYIQNKHLFGSENQNPLRKDLNKITWVKNTISLP